MKTHKEWLDYFQSQYIETGNPLCLLSAYCHLSAANDRTADVVIPGWMASPLAEGFAGYLNGLTSDLKTSLEDKLLITAEHKQTAVRTSLELMAEWVHRIVWLFDIDVSEAAHAVYMEFESDAKTMNLLPKQQGITRDEKGFLQFCHRSAKKGLKAFIENESKGLTPTEDQKNELLTNWSEPATKYIRQKVKLKTF